MQTTRIMTRFFTQQCHQTYRWIYIYIYIYTSSFEVQTTSISKALKPYHVRDKMFGIAGGAILNIPMKWGVFEALRRFKSVIGLSPLHCSISWSYLFLTLLKSTEPKDLMIALVILKVYGNESQHRAILGVSERKIRKWTWLIIHQIAKLNFVSLLFSSLPCITF